MKFCSLVTELQLNLLILHWFKGNNSITFEASLTKINMQTQIIVIYTYCKFHEILLVDCHLVNKWLVNLQQFKGNNSCIIEAIPTKLCMHAVVIQLH